MCSTTLNLLRLHENSPRAFSYRYVECGTLEINGMPDYRIQKAHEYTKRYSDMYLLDNQMQLLTAMEDFEYTKWIDPDRVPCYVRDVVS